MDLISEMLYPTPLVVSPLLPLLLMSLSRDKHTPNIASHVLSEYDYVIVGAGSAGSVLAGRLSEMACVNVLLLEAGKSPPRLTDVPAIARSFVNTDVDWRYKTAPQKHTGAMHNNRQIAWPSGKMVGGSGVLNAMFAVRGNRKNYDDWAEMGATGWSYEEVLPYFIKMEDNRNPEFARNGFHGVGGPQTIEKPPYTAPIKNPLIETAKMLGYKFIDPNGPFQTGFFDFQASSRNGQRCSAAKAYLVPAENRTNLHILTHAFVRKVLIVNRRAVGVEFDFKGRTHVVKARKEVILSAGTINTAQLLMLSGIGPRRELKKFNIPVVADLPVGYNLQDHQGSPIIFYLTGGRTKSILMRLLNQKNVMEYIKSRTGVLASAEGCSLVAFLESRSMVPRTLFPDHEIYFLEVPLLIIKTQLNFKTDVFYKYFGPYLAKPLVLCIPQILHPRSRGRVYLQSANPHDPPIIDPNYYDHPQDLDDVLQGMKVCMKMNRSPAMRKLGVREFKTVIPGCEAYVGQEDNYLRCQARSAALTLNHQVGTAKMGNPSDPTTVVDPQLRVKSIKGLRVVDASVMPLVPSGNTNLPTMMVAEKAADMIKATVGCKHLYRGQEGFSPVDNKHLFTSFSGIPILNHEAINVPNVDIDDHSPFAGHGFHSDEHFATANAELLGSSHLNQDEFLEFKGLSNLHANPHESSSSDLNEFFDLNAKEFPNLNKEQLLNLNQEQYEILKQFGLKNTTRQALRKLNKSLFPDQSLKKPDNGKWKAVKKPRIQKYLSSKLQNFQNENLEISSKSHPYNSEYMYHEQFMNPDRAGISTPMNSSLLAIDLQQEAQKENIDLEVNTENENSDPNETLPNSEKSL